MTTGGMLSPTVTIAVSVDTLPFTSVTVRVTVFSPTSALVTSVMSKTKLCRPQLSLLPASIWSAVILASPLASSCMLMSCAKTIGLVLSSTVTTAVPEPPSPPTPPSPEKP